MYGIISSILKKFHYNNINYNINYDILLNYQLFLPMDIGVNIFESLPVRVIIKLWKNWTIEINANIL